MDSFYSNRIINLPHVLRYWLFHFLSLQMLIKVGLAFPQYEADIRVEMSLRIRNIFQPFLICDPEVFLDIMHTTRAVISGSTAVFILGIPSILWSAKKRDLDVYVPRGTSRISFLFYFLTSFLTICACRKRDRYESVLSDTRLHPCKDNSH